MRREAKVAIIVGGVIGVFLVAIASHLIAKWVSEAANCQGALKTGHDGRVQNQPV